MKGCGQVFRLQNLSLVSRIALLSGFRYAQFGLWSLVAQDT